MTTPQHKMAAPLLNAPIWPRPLVRPRPQHDHSRLPNDHAPTLKATPPFGHTPRAKPRPVKPRPLQSVSAPSLGHAPGCKPRPHQGHAHTPVPPQSIGHTAAYKPLPLPLTTPPSLSHAPLGAKPRPLVRPRPPPGSSCPSRTPKTLLRVPGAVPVPTLSRSRRTPPAERPPPGVPQCHGARGPPNCLGGAKRGGQVVMGGTHGIRGHRG